MSRSKEFTPGVVINGSDLRRWNSDKGPTNSPLDQHFITMTNPVLKPSRSANLLLVD